MDKALATSFRTHTCNDLRLKDKGLRVKLSGWVHTKRDHGDVLFIDLRDRYGLTQIVFDPKQNKALYDEAVKLRSESVITIEGIVRPRPKDSVNKKLSTGEVEVLVDKLRVLAKSDVTPIVVDDYAKIGENARLKYRYLDLRRPIVQKNLIKRHEFVLSVRNALSKLGFVEIETPLLIRHTPEGARDFIVPSRLHPGRFYALPQSPQIYKQLLMVSGFDRYFQIAKCLRDEDLRADRQPEFTQIDLEMSFADEEDVFRIVETFLAEAINKCFGVKLKTPFPRITYQEAMNKYGTDKPDLRFNLKLVDVTDIAKKTDFEIFKQSSIVKALPINTELSRKQIEELTDIAIELKAKGLAWVKVVNNDLQSGIAKFLKPIKEELIEAMPKAKTILFQAGSEKRVNQVLSALRNHVGKMLKLYNRELFFVWVTNFPLFEFNEDSNSLEPAHHPFTGIKPGFERFLETNPEKIISRSYDLVLNGWELGSGSVRLTDPELLKQVLKLIGLSEEQSVEKFGFLMQAFAYGVPPHAGIALGLDRLLALLLGYEDIREVIAFPKNKAAQNPMDGSPSRVDEQHLRELHIKIDEKKG